MALSKRVLFCYINPSTGHQRAAEAVMAALRHMNPRVESHGVNSISYANPVVGKMVAGLYLNVLKHAPQLWDFLYDNPLIEGATRDLRELLHVFNTGKIYRLLKHYRPRCLVCTQAVPMMVLSNLKRRGKLKTPLVGILTDFGVHGYWISRHVDLYLVPTEEVKRQLVRRGVRESRVQVTGIPTDPGFAARGDRRAERERLGLDPARPAVLVMGGSHGLGPMDEMVDALRCLPAGPQVLVVCGNNRRLQKDLHSRFPDDPSVRVFGHVRSVPRLMDAADLLVSKPGGLTSSEAMAKGLPMLMIHPIPGQEERNAQYLARHGAAERAQTVKELADKAEELLAHRERLERLRERALSLAKPWAAYDAAAAILSIIQEPVLSRPRTGDRVRTFGHAPAEAPGRAGAFSTLAA